MNEMGFEKFKSNLAESLLWATDTKEIDNIVDTFLREISIYYKLDCASVYFLTGNQLILRGIYGLDRYYVCKIYRTITNEEYQYLFLQRNVYIGENMSKDNSDIFYSFKSMTVLPIIEYPSLMGSLVFYSKENKEEYFHSVLNEVSLLVRHFSIYASNILQRVAYEDKDRQILLINELAVSFATNEDLTNPLDRLAENLTKIFSSEKAVITLAEEDGTMSLRSVWGYDDNHIKDAPFINNIILDRKNCYINYVDKSNEYEYLRPWVRHSIMCLPLTANNNIVGVVAVVDRKLSATNPLGDFTDSDENLFRNTVSHIAGQIHEYNTRRLLNKATKHNELNTRRLNVLYELTNSLLGKSKKEDIIFILMTATTLGESFAFNRAFVFMYDEDTSSFKGQMCVAPVNAKDAGDIWLSLERKKNYSLREKLLLLLTERDVKNTTMLNEKLVKISIPVDDECLLFKHLYENKVPVNIKNPDTSYLAMQVSNFTDIFGHTPFAIVPILGASSCIGAVVVDNSFNNKPILDEDLVYIKMFGKQTGIALEYSNLYATIEERNKELRLTQDRLNEAAHLAIIGEMSASISHNLRNFIVPISGFTNRLKKMEDLDPTAKNYANIISEEMVKLEQYIKKNLSFSKTIKLEFEDISIEKMSSTIEIITNESIYKSEKNITFEVDVPKENFTLHWDFSRMNEVFLNIILNAIDAIEMKEGGKIFFVVKRNEHNEKLVDISIKNTGSYIKKDIIKNIFEPFFTTKSHGVGLGLSSSKRIIAAHGGSIRVESSRDPDCVNFIMTIPIIVE